MVAIDSFKDFRNEPELEIYLEDEDQNSKTKPEKPRISQSRPIQMSQVSISSKSKRSNKTDIMNVMAIEDYIIR